MCDNKMTIQFPKNYATGRNQTKHPAFYFQNQRKTLHNNFTKKSLNKQKCLGNPAFMRVCSTFKSLLITI